MRFPVKKRRISEVAGECYQKSVWRTKLSVKLLSVLVDAQARVSRGKRDRENFKKTYFETFLCLLLYKCRELENSFWANLILYVTVSYTTHSLVVVQQ